MSAHLVVWRELPADAQYPGPYQIKISSPALIRLVANTLMVRSVFICSEYRALHCARVRPELAMLNSPRSHPASNVRYVLRAERAYGTLAFCP